MTVTHRPCCACAVSSGGACPGSARQPFPGLPGSGEVIVHGDFGPQNLLLSSDARDVPAVVDWEWCHLGSAGEGLGFIGGGDPGLPAPSRAPPGDAPRAGAATAHAPVTRDGFTTPEPWARLGRGGPGRYLAPAPGS